jgi:hypothetical protein
VEYIRWWNSLDDQDLAHIHNVTEWWIERVLFREQLYRFRTDPDAIERMVVSLASFELAIALKQTLKKLRRKEGEEIQFEEVREAIGQARRDLIRQMFRRFGEERKMDDPCVNWRQLTSHVEDLLGRLERQKTVEFQLRKLARAVAQRPKAAPAIEATTPADAPTETDTVAEDQPSVSVSLGGTEAKTDTRTDLSVAGDETPEAKHERDAQTAASDSVRHPPVNVGLGGSKENPGGTDANALRMPPQEASARSPEESRDAAAEPSAKRRHPGPSKDYETALRVAAIVTPFGPQWSSGETLDEVLEALEEKKIPTPRTWPKREEPLNSWTAAGLDSETRDLARKAIKYYLNLAEEALKL